MWAFGISSPSTIAEAGYFNARVTQAACDQLPAWAQAKVADTKGLGAVTLTNCRPVRITTGGSPWANAWGFSDFEAVRAVGMPSSAGVVGARTEMGCQVFRASYFNDVPQEMRRRASAGTSDCVPLNVERLP
jgi:hypothetical protein